MSSSHNVEYVVESLMEVTGARWNQWSREHVFTTREQAEKSMRFLNQRRHAVPCVFRVTERAKP